jgi:hypothetical protein
MIQAATDVLRRSLADSELIDDWRPSSGVEEQLISLNVPYVRVRGLSQTMDLAVQRRWQSMEPPSTPLELLGAWLADDEIRRILDVHRYETEEYLRKEALEILLRWHFLQAVLDERVGFGPEEVDRKARVAAWWELVKGVSEMALASEYRVRDLLDRLERSSES